MRGKSDLSKSQDSRWWRCCLSFRPFRWSQGQTKGEGPVRETGSVPCRCSCGTPSTRETGKHGYRDERTTAPSLLRGSFHQERARHSPQSRARVPSWRPPDNSQVGRGSAPDHHSPCPCHSDSVNKWAVHFLALQHWLLSIIARYFYLITASL